jgi:hypothetical protein
MDIPAEQAEINRRAIIRAIMDDTSLTYEQAEAEESRRFQRALSTFLRSGRLR